VMVFVSHGHNAPDGEMFVAIALSKAPTEQEQLLETIQE